MKVTELSNEDLRDKLLNLTYELSGYNNELINEILKRYSLATQKSERWDALDAEIGKYYKEDLEDEMEDDFEDGNLLDIGEAAASAFGYL